MSFSSKKLDETLKLALREIAEKDKVRKEHVINFLTENKIEASETELRLYLILMQSRWHGDVVAGITMRDLCNNITEKNKFRSALQKMKDRGHVEYIDPTGWRLSGKAKDLCWWQLKVDRENE